MELWEILVPTQWNDGTPIKLAHHKVWDKNIKALTGGITILVPAKGQWISAEGVTFNERMIPVRFAVDELNERHIEMTVIRIMQFTCQHYDQEAIMCYKVSDKCWITDRKTLLGKEVPFWRTSVQDAETKRESS